jgi:hypothetical protein
MLEYRALGGLCVVDDGDDVNLGGPRQRRLAAALLIDRNRVVSVDRLGKVVFAGEPTPGAATKLRSYVVRLRRVVEGAGSGSRVVTQQPGYMLEVEDTALDVARFEASVATGRARLTRGDPAEASRAVREGLGRRSPRRPPGPCRGRTRERHRDQPASRTERDAATGWRRRAASRGASQWESALHHRCRREMERACRFHRGIEATREPAAAACTRPRRVPGPTTPPTTLEPMVVRP